MGLKEDFKDLGDKLKKLQGDPEKFRFALAIAILGLGMVAIKMPLSARIQGKKMELIAAEELAERADRVMQLRKAAGLIEDRLNQPSDPSDWQQYLYTIIEETGVSVPQQEKSDPKTIYDFEQIIIPLHVTGNYSQIWKFIDTVERGERLMRFENINLTLSEGILTLRCELYGIARPAQEEMMMDGDSMESDGGGDGGEAPPPRDPEEDYV